jgi:hypothetical protein
MKTVQLPYEGPELSEYRRTYDDLAKATLNVEPSEDGGASSGRVATPRSWKRDRTSRRAVVNT